YSQACDGGFEHLVVKFSEDYGILPAESFPYTSGADGTVSSCDAQLDGDRYTFTRYEYLGGYYGASNEALMLNELYLNGPMPVSIEVYDDFHDYAGGVYYHKDDELTTSFFEPTSHSVLLVGYGFDEDEQLPFWTIQNSWADGWGEEGYIRIVRGVDNCAVESAPVRFFWQP
ncbi:peptidase C1A, partial [Kipferlia bialata]